MKINDSRLCYFICMVLVSALLACSKFSPENNTAELTCTVKKLTELIKTEEVPFIREVLAERLENEIRRNYASNINTDEIDEILSLLKSNDDIVRLWAANTLGYIGTPAKYTLPQLQEALKKEESKTIKKPHFDVSTSLRAYSSGDDACYK